MRRRDFITALGGAAAVWPLAARAQQSVRMRRIGVLINTTESDSEGQARVAAFREELAKLGWTDGREVHIEYRWTGGDPARASAYAAELIALKPEVVFAAPTSSLRGLPFQSVVAAPSPFLLIRYRCGTAGTVGQKCPAIGRSSARYRLTATLSSRIRMRAGDEGKGEPRRTGVNNSIPPRCPIRSRNATASKTPR